MPMNDITDMRFGRLIALSPSTERKDGKIVWDCFCDCGSFIKVLGTSLRSGGTRSCGCLNKDSAKSRFFKHGDSPACKSSKSPNNQLYHRWLEIKKRCSNPNVINYVYYGGKGISVCSEWLDYINFKNWALLNGYEQRLTIDRIDNSGNYEPDNCRWITRAENASRARRQTLFREHREVQDACQG